MRTPALIAGLALAAGLAGVSAPAHAAPRVGIDNEAGDARIDPTYATTLTVRGTGFQSVPNGFGGIYVFFGTTSAGWRPSQGGQTGSDYFYVPDSEARNNQGYQRFVAFAGSDTEDSANGGTVSGDGSWSTDIVVPGAVFEAYDRAGGSRTVDCRTTTCGIITVGAHGVTNARNESFTPVNVSDLYDGEAPAAAPSASSPPLPTEPSPADPVAAPAPAGPPAAGEPVGATPPQAVSAVPAILEVDRAAARAGNVLAFAASGLPPATQVSAVLDDGVAGAGPFLVGPDGRLSGVITIPEQTDAGTHELRLFGIEDAPTVRFAIAAAEVAADEIGRSAVEPSDQRAALVFVAAAGILLLLALGRLMLRRRGVTRV